MKSTTRRNFLKQSTMGAGALLALGQFPKTLLAESHMMKDVSLGFQSFTIRDQLGKDFGGTLKKMSGMGYKLVEMCSPKGYAQIGFGPLASMKTADIKKTIEDAGLTCPSCHFGFGEFTDKLDETITFSKELGLSHVVCSTFWLPKTATLNDYLVAADKLNKAGEKIKAAGMQAGFHNHSFEFARLDGELIYDALLKRFDADLVKLQFQTEVINLGYKAADYFKNYPGRFISSHLSDWTSDKKEAAVGNGVIDWKEFFAAAPTGGVKHYFVEMGYDKFQDSASYIKKL